ncbi:MAG TPA: N-acetylmuramoyl-L-alanine amidase [Xanthobacteraceae bacterium]|nr:N-acetylmuramoyl-L-alanine amidase [Xanthobacteraceae bacterium]
MVVCILARALAKPMSNLGPAKVSAGRAAAHIAARMVAMGRQSGGLLVSIIVLAIALDLAWPLNARSQMPLPLPVPLPAAEAPPIATDARLAGDDKQTRLVIDLSRKIDMRAFTLADPYRVVIDIPQVNFQLPPNTGDRGRGVIKAFRYGLVMSGGSRIVLDLTGPVRVTKAFVLDPVDGQPARMVLNLTAVDRETFLRAAAIDNHLPRPPEPPSLARPDREEHTTDPRPLVVLDPGHGGIDPGTRAPSGELEKNLVLEFTSMLRNKLEGTGKYRVVMTRADDTFVQLSERVRFARQRQAQLLISIHCDALARGSGEAEGATVYTLSDQASDAETQRLADAENRADVIAGVDLAAEPDDIADILIDLAQRETRSFSAHFARSLVNEMRTAAHLHKRPHRSAGFRILKAPDVPSVLIELGYVSNARDLKQLVSESWRSRTSDAIVHAVQTYFTTRLAGGGAAPAQ